MPNFEKEQETKLLAVKMETLAYILNKANKELGVDEKWKLATTNFTKGYCDIVSNKKISEATANTLNAMDIGTRFGEVIDEDKSTIIRVNTKFDRIDTIIEGDIVCGIEHGAVKVNYKNYLEQSIKSAKAQAEMNKLADILNKIGKQYHPDQEWQPIKKLDIKRREKGGEEHTLSWHSGKDPIAIIRLCIPDDDYDASNIGDALDVIIGARELPKDKLIDNNLHCEETGVKLIFRRPFYYDDNDDHPWKTAEELTLVSFTGDINGIQKTIANAKKHYAKALKDFSAESQSQINTTKTVKPAKTAKTIKDITNDGR